MEIVEPLSWPSAERREVDPSPRSRRGHDAPLPSDADGVDGAAPAAAEGSEDAARRRTRISALRLRSLSRAERSSSARNLAGMNNETCEVFGSTARAYRRDQRRALSDDSGGCARRGKTDQP